MSISAPFEHLLDRVRAGEPLTADELAQLATTPDILPLGMLADTVRRALHGAQVTYVRVALCAADKPFPDAIPAAARELRITGKPASVATALNVIEAARTAAADRVVSAFAWADIEEWAAADGGGIATLLGHLLGTAGLDAISHLPLDRIDDAAGVLEQMVEAGFQRVRLTIDKAPAAARTPLLIAAAHLQDRFACIQAISPLPMTLEPMRPTTGYDDVKTIAIARLAAPTIPCVQVDWLRYGPKLAQVALTFGADDIDNVMASDEAPDGRRRAPIEELRRNIETAGFEPAERDGQFVLIA